MKPNEVWAQLKRRRVVRVAIAYALAVFVALQVADLTFEPLGLPEWSYRFLLLAAIAGRLWDAAGDVQRAPSAIAGTWGSGTLADPALQDEANTVRRRLTELEGQRAG